jgi:hypothetical protein
MLVLAAILFTKIFTMTATSAWFLNINAQLNRPELTPEFEREAMGYAYKVYLTADSCWLVADWANGARTAFRLAYSPNDTLKLDDVSEKDGNITFRISPLIGEYEAVVRLPVGR